MLTRCRGCGAVRTGSPFGNGWLLRRTAATTECLRCGGAEARARRDARRATEKTAVRDWLLAAPENTEGLLAEARTTGPTGTGPGLTLRPWLDTLDLEVATDWLHTVLDLGGRPWPWPPATDDACTVLWRWFAATDRADRPLDIGALFGGRGFPWPPVPGGLRDPDRAWSVLIEAGLIDALRRPEPRVPVALPPAHRDVLRLEAHLTDNRSPGLTAQAQATGSVLHDDAGRVLVVWH